MLKDQGLKIEERHAASHLTTYNGTASRHSTPNEMQLNQNQSNDNDNKSQQNSNTEKEKQHSLKFDIEMPSITLTRANNTNKSDSNNPDSRSLSVLTQSSISHNTIQASSKCVKEPQTAYVVSLQLLLSFLSLLPSRCSALGHLPEMRTTTITQTKER